MSSIILSVIIVSFVVAVFTALFFINNKQKRKAAAMLRLQLSKSAAENNLSFSSQELLQELALGLDTAKLKLLVLEKIDKCAYEWDIIDLKMVKNCAVKKIYQPLYGGKSKNNENHLDKIVLQIEFADNSAKSEVTFYSYTADGIYEMKVLEDKARRWESMLLQMTGNKLQYSPGF